jgi:hypothetical protein
MRPSLDGLPPGQNPADQAGQWIKGLAFAASAADLSHVAPIAADPLATLLSSLSRFGRRKLMCRSSLVRGSTACRSDGALAGVAHASEAAPITRGAP